MMMGMVLKLAFALALGAAMIAGRAEASMQWRWSCEGPGYQASGAFTTGDTPDADGFYPITAVSGKANGVAITGLQPAGTAIPGNPGYPVNNLIRTRAPQLSNEGFGFALADGTFANPFYGAHFDPPGPLVFVSDPARNKTHEPRVEFEAVQVR
jgi:hypothetical protein